MDRPKLSTHEKAVNILLVLSLLGIVFGAPGVIEADGGPSAWGSGGFAMYADGADDDNNRADSDDPTAWIGVKSRLHDTIITTDQNAKVEVRVANDDQRQSHTVEFALLTTESGYRETVVLRDTIRVPAGETKDVTYEFLLTEMAQQSISFPHTIWVETAVSSDEGRVSHSTRSTAGQLTFRQQQWKRLKAQLFALSLLVMLLTAIASSTLHKGVNQILGNLREQLELKSSSQGMSSGFVALLGQSTRRIIQLASKGSKEHHKRFSDDPGISIGALFLSYLVCLPILVLSGLLTIVTETLDSFVPSVSAYNGTILTYLAGLYFISGLVGYFVVLGTARE